MTGLRAGELARIRDDEGNTVLSYRSFASVVGIVAALVSGIVLVAGLASVAFLFAENSPIRAIVALILTLVFAFVISMLVPRVSVTLYDADDPALTIVQTTVFPSSSFVVATANGAALATLRKSAFSRLGRNRWTIHQDGRYIGHAVEESLGRALTRKLLGKFNRRYEANVRVEAARLDVAMIRRRGADADSLELQGDALDPRVAVALATLILGSEP